MITRLTQFHEQERLVAVTQTTIGKFGLWITGIALLAWHDAGALMMVALLLVMVFPDRRRIWLSLAALGVIVGGILERQGVDPGITMQIHETLSATQWGHLFAGIMAVILGLYIIFLITSHFDQLPSIVRRYPLVTLHGGIWAGLFLSPLPWLGVLAQSPFLAWRISYLVTSASRGKAAGTRFHDHLFYLIPIWGGTSTPYGKGLDYLSRHEAFEPELFARSQLAGIKLLVLAVFWTLTLEWMDALFFGQGSSHSTGLPWGWALGLPHLADMMRSDVSYTAVVAWAVIYLELVRATLALAVTGHIIIGCLRLLGFNVYRNTYRPLLSESILEFWNRYYYYFKEVLVEFFFYPTYLRCTFAGPRLRLFLAVFAAAFVGNMYFHLLANPTPIINGDWVSLWTIWGPRLVYCLLLALGIWVSMLRQQKQRASASQVGMPVRLRRIAGVLSFYALIRVWSVRSPEIGFFDRLEFLTSLFGF